MRIITGKHIPRRTFLGGTLALPFLEAMLPARAGAKPRRSSESGGGSLERTRLVCIEMVHGAAGSTRWGATQNFWSPAAEGRDFDLSPTALSRLEPFRKYLTIVSDTDVRNAEAVEPKEIGGDHFRSSAVFLTQAHPKQTESSDVFVGTSMDQLYARRFGQDTPIPSMQLCIENVDQGGGCAYGYSCVYTDTISWASPTEPLPMIRDPRVAFDLLFGAGGTPEERAARRQASKSILDFVLGEVAQLERELDAADRRRIDQYLENIREVERRIQKVEERNRSGQGKEPSARAQREPQASREASAGVGPRELINESRELPEAPAGVPDSFDEHVKLMFDVQALAFQGDMTRVFSFKMGRDASGRVYPESGVDKPFHPASHHGDKEKNIEEFFQINRYHVSLVPYFLAKLQSIHEGDSTLLDKTMVIYGSPMGDPNVHNHKRCPLFVIGGANGKLEGGVHLKAAPGTPMANVMLSLMHRLGLDDIETFGDSTGPFSLAV